MHEPAEARGAVFGGTLSDPEHLLVTGPRVGHPVPVGRHVWAGDRIAVRIENVGDVAYRYQPFYQACFLSYFDSQGPEFIIPPGTHCDMLGGATIRPEETERLFMWDLDECVRDSWAA